MTPDVFPKGRARVRAKKKYGQHFLEAGWADKLVAKIEPRPEDRFIEIGPGPGALTVRIAPRVESVTAIELDADMVSELQPRLPPNVTLVHADFLEFDMSALAPKGPFRVAGNLPYNVSSPILFRLIDAYRTTGCLLDATLMVQREVADRIAAAPGNKDYGVLSIFIQMHADVRRLLSLPPGAFRPAPRVHSSVVNLRFRAPAVQVADARSFETTVRSMFTQRRKTLLNALGPFASSIGREAGPALDAAGIDRRRRPETLQLAELARLADYFTSAPGRAVL